GHQEPTSRSRFGILHVGLRVHGWHGYRRALATNLKQLGIDDVVIQGILRHSDVSTTRKHYIKTVPQMATDAMQKLASQIQWATARFARYANNPVKSQLKPT